MIGSVIVVMLVVLALAAPRYGVDTRTSDSWTAREGFRPAPRRGPTLRGDVLAVARTVAGVGRRALLHR